MRRSFRGPRVIVPKANEKVAFGASPKLTNFRLYLLSHEELLTQDSGLTLFPHEYGGPHFIRNCCHDLISLLTKQKPMKVVRHSSTPESLHPEKSTGRRP